MKKQTIKQLAQSIAKSDTVSQEVSDWIFKNLNSSEIKLFLRCLLSEIKNFTVIAKYAGETTDEIKEKIKQMFPNKNIVYIRADEEVGAGIKFEFGDYILDYTVSAMITKIMKTIRENL
jgi:F-type H+-transporting ATPase subunit delta